MANTYNKVLLAGLQASYDALATKDANVLYFCTDSRKLYKGDIDFSNDVVVAATKPGTPYVGKIYILGDTNTVETWDGSKWHVISYPMATSVDNTSDDMHVASAKAVYNAITKAVADVTGGAALVKKVEAGDQDAEIVVTMGDDSTSDVVVPGVVTTPTWDAATRKLTLPVSGGTAVEINIGKDIFLDTEADNKYNAETGNIELHLNDGTTIEIPAASLVDVYTGGTTNSAKATVSDQNVITVDVVVDPVEGNALVLTEAGLKVSLADYYKATEVDALVKTAKDAADAAQALADTNKAAIAKLNGDETTEGSVAKAVKDAVDGLKANEIKAAQDAADGAQAAAEAAQGTADEAKGLAESAHEALDVLNGDETTEGSVAKDIKDAVDSLKANEIKAAQDAADAAQAQADKGVEDAATAQAAAEAAQAQADKGVQDAATAQAAAEAAQGTADGAQAAAEAAQGTADANAEEIAAIAASLGWGTF